MKLLCFTDMHGSMKALKRIKDTAKKKKPDYILCAGDFTVFEQNMESIMKKLDQIKIPVMMIPGNHETGDSVKLLCNKFKNIIYINKGMLKTDDAIFIANEGNGFSIEDSPFKKWGVKVLKDFKKESRKGRKVILLTHAPPYGTKVDLILEDHCGNKAVRNFIEKLQPDIAVSGHLHECAGNHDKINNTVVLNPGPYGTMVTI